MAGAGKFREVVTVIPPNVRILGEGYVRRGSRMMMITNNSAVVSARACACEQGADEYSRSTISLLRKLCFEGVVSCLTRK